MRQQKQSQVINNFFTFASIVIISISLILYSEYILKDEPIQIKKQKVQPLACQSDTLTKYQIYNQELLNESLKALQKGYYKLNAKVNKADSNSWAFKDFMSKKELKSYFIMQIGKKPKENIKKYLSIDYSVIEKSSSAKVDSIKRGEFYSGSFLVTFKADEKKIFKIFTDFRFYEKSEIKSRVECIINVYKNNAKKL
ncbi:MAG: hypothetical protein ACQERD_00380 [Campylobacterota bacterium]